MAVVTSVAFWDIIGNFALLLQSDGRRMFCTLLSKVASRQ